MRKPQIRKPQVLSVTSLLRPHWKAMTMALVGVGGIAVTELLEPWPLKIVIDHLLQDRPPQGWLGAAVGWFGADTMAVLNVAVLRKKEGELLSIVQEVFSSIRVVKAFAREDYGERRFERQSLDNLETTLAARNIKMTLAPVVEIIVATGTCLMLWYGARLVIASQLTPGALVVFLLYTRTIIGDRREAFVGSQSLRKIDRPPRI